MNPYKIAFAPLQGYTDAAYRTLHHELFGGIDAYYTPFVRIERGGFRNRELRDVDPENNPIPHLIPQAIARTPDELERIIELLHSLEYKEIDLNMGCPFPLLAHKHKGSGILPYPDEVAALLEVAKRYPMITFSIKMRLGWDDPNQALQLLPILNEAPLSHITMHTRTGKMGYKGETLIDHFTPFYEGSKHPLYYNGDLNTVEDITAITTQFPQLEGVMLGRGLLANPMLAMEYREGVATATDELYRKVAALHEGLFDHYEPHLQGEAQLLAHLKPHWEYLLPHADKKLRKLIQKSNSLSRYQQAVANLLASGINDL